MLDKYFPDQTQQKVAEHAAFHDGLTAFKAYCVAVQQGEQAYDQAQIRAILDSFGDSFQQHLRDEVSRPKSDGSALRPHSEPQPAHNGPVCVQIPLLTPENMRQIDSKEFNEMTTTAEAAGKSGMSKQPFTALPFFLSNHDTKLKPAWPPMPALLLFLNRHVFYRWNAG